MTSTRPRFDLDAEAHQAILQWTRDTIDSDWSDSVLLQKHVRWALAAAFRAGLERAYQELCAWCRIGEPAVKLEGLWWHEHTGVPDYCLAGILREEAEHHLPVEEPRG